MPLVHTESKMRKQGLWTESGDVICLKKKGNCNRLHLSHEIT